MEKGECNFSLQKDILAGCCVVGYGLGLFYVTPGGQIMLEMVDYYGGTILILALASCEIIAFNWIYGTSFIGRAQCTNLTLWKHLELWQKLLTA